VIVIAREGRVPAPVEEVWAVVGRVEALPTWLVGLRRIAVSGPEGLGRRLWLAGSRAGYARAGGGPGGGDPGGGGPGRGGSAGGGPGGGGPGGGLRDGPGRPAEIVAWKPPTLLAWRCVSDGVPAAGLTRPDEVHVQLTPEGGHTRVELYAVSHAAGPAGWLLRLAVGRRWRDDLARSVAALAELCTGWSHDI
jgi:hypothetical protein